MGRSPCCDNKGLKKGTWTPEEDRILVSYIQQHGHDNWRALPRLAGLSRCGKSCRLRWINYLRPDIKRGNFTAEEEETILKMHETLGNRWSTIAAKLSGRTDNEIKNHWRTHLKKRALNNTIKSGDDSKGSSQTTAMKDTNSPALKDFGDERRNSEMLNEDFWADVFSESSFSMEVESGLEAESLASRPTPSICDDVATTSHTCWSELGDTLDYFSDTSMNNVSKCNNK